MPQTFEITAPNGKTLEITGDHMPTEAEMQDIFAKAGVGTSNATPVSDSEPGTFAGGFLRGLKQYATEITQPPTVENNKALQVLGTPLAHTGVDAVDSMTSPIGLATVAAAGGGALARSGGGVMNRAVALAQSVGEQAAPALKYQVVKSGLEAMGLPASVSTPIALTVSAYKGSAAAPEEPPANPNYARMRNTSQMSPEEIAARTRPNGRLGGIKGNAAAKIQAANAAAASEAPAVAAPESVSGDTPPPAGPPPSPTPPAAPAAGNGYPDQKALNEEAIARRRAEYQARVAAQQDTPPAAPAKPRMEADITREYMRLRNQGMSDEAAKKALEAMLKLRSGMSLPTDAELDKFFPKGMRGKPVIRP